jgi:hypothetical protein
MIKIYQNDSTWTWNFRLPLFLEEFDVLVPEVASVAVQIRCKDSAWAGRLG